MAQKTSRKWQPIGSIEMALSFTATEAAFSRLDYTPPTLVVSRLNSGIGRRIARDMAINFRTDKALGNTEWFVEWRGKRFGSTGQ